jgi:hypothetical protein
MGPDVEGLDEHECVLMVAAAATMAYIPIK